MPLHRALELYRKTFAYWWLALSFGCVYLLSQVTIGALIQQLGPQDIGKLQISAFTARDYLETFTHWERSGVMPFYRAHFTVDGIHWLWYSISLTAWLALAMDAARVASRYNAALLLPLVAGLCDCLENAIQHIFLSDPQFRTIVDPLPLISTMASITKWASVTLAVLLIVVFFARSRLRRS